MPHARPVGPAPTTRASNAFVMLTACSRLRGRRLRAPPAAPTHPCRRLPPYRDARRLCRRSPAPALPTSFPACTLPVRSLVTAATIATPSSSAEASTTTAALPLIAQRIGQRPHLLRGPCRPSAPPARLTPLTAARLRFQSPPMPIAPASLSAAPPGASERAPPPAVFSTCSTSSGSRGAQHVRDALQRVRRFLILPQRALRP